uniref:Putative secreted protein n=1 Tax=Xenopsylla cheopis TaxID=163159 RepID=A0A6M2DUJ9_XENCH
MDFVACCWLLAATKVLSIDGQVEEWGFGQVSGWSYYKSRSSISMLEEVVDAHVSARILGIFRRSGSIFIGKKQSFMV